MSTLLKYSANFSSILVSRTLVSNIWVSSILVLSFAPTVSAQQWQGSAEAGIIKTSGNTESDTFNVGFNVTYSKEKWKNALKASHFQASNDRIESAKSTSADYRLERDLSERTNVFFSASYLDDDFDGFTEKVSASIGLGYALIDSEKTQWNTAIGTGYQDTDVINAAPENNRNISGETLVLRSDFTTQLTSNTSFGDSFKSDINTDNSFYENEAFLKVSMNDTFSLKLSYLIRHNSDPGLGTEKTDTISTLSLVYNIK